VLATLDIEVLSDDWAGTAYLRSNRTEPIDKKVLRSHFPESRAYVAPRDIRALGIDSSQVNWMEFSNIRSFGVSGDNSVLETRFKNSPAEAGMACLESIIRVLGENSLLRLQFTQPGCSRWAIVQFGETELDGKYTDLSPFSADVSRWRTVRMAVRNGKASVFLDNKLVYRHAYRQPVGAIRGIVYNFRGYGAVDYVKLFDAQNRLRYEEAFEK
jgi:hypothetical protein